MEETKYNVIHRYLVLSCGLTVLLFPFTYYVWPVAERLRFLWNPLAQKLHSLLFANESYSYEIASDSSELLCFFISIALISIPYSLLLKNRNTVQFHLVVARFFAIFILLRYGLDKITKTQFYLPEPNTLYTPIGLLDKDISFWTLIGSNYPLNIILGSIEVSIALLLFFSKTRILGWLLSLINFSIILCINICFAISVKYLTTFLVVISLVQLYPALKTLISFFIHKQIVALPKENTLALPIITKWFLKFFSVITLLFEIYYPFKNSSAWNDDKVARPYLHGAYAISNDSIWKRLFIHRKGYLILQNSNNEMFDYPITIDSATFQLLIDNQNGKTTKGHFKKLHDNIIYFELPIKRDTFRFSTTPLPYHNLPLLL